jgi:hypothetical protein
LTENHRLIREGFPDFTIGKTDNSGRHNDLSITLPPQLCPETDIFDGGLNDIDLLDRSEFTFVLVYGHGRAASVKLHAGQEIRIIRRGS